MKTQSIELETLKQLELMTKANSFRPALALPKYCNSNMVVTNGHVAIKVADDKYKDDGREDYPNNAVQLFNSDPVEWIELTQGDMKALKDFAATFKRLKETNIVITFGQDDFNIKGYNNKIETILPYQNVTLSGDIVGKSIMMDPKYIEQILAYYIKLKATSVNLEWTSEKNPIKVTSGPIEYLACQIRTPR